MSSTAKNLEAISKALDRHKSSCGLPVLEIRLNPFEADRLGWEDFVGVPIVGDADIPTGRFSLVCEGDHAPAESVQVEQRKTLRITEPVFA